MSRSAIVILGSLLFGCLIYALSPGPGHLITNPTNWELREQLVFLSGLCTVTLMVVSMLISARLGFISKLMNGLDKGYVVHKWTGILSTLFVTAHFLLESVPHWLVEGGYVSDPGELTDGSKYSELEINLFQSGVVVAQPVFYLMMLLVIIALFRKIPYKWFRKSHKLFPYLFIAASWHAGTAQLKEHWQGTPGSFLLMVVLAVGIGVAIMAITRNIGRKRTAKAIVTRVDVHANDIIDITVRFENSSFSYHPGQYVFLKFSHDDEPHPFSIASCDEKRDTLRFAIKQLGDFTSKLTTELTVGHKVQVEGPYGEFHFNDTCERQIWIAGGIGVTPFMSRLEYLSRNGGSQKIEFWYSTRHEKNLSFPSSLEKSCEQAGINFYHLDSTQKNYLTVDMVKERTGDLENTSIWFCGPEEFSMCLKRGLKASGFNMRKFHYDSFIMR